MKARLGNLEEKAGDNSKKLEKVSADMNQAKGAGRVLWLLALAVPTLVASGIAWLVSKSGG